MEDVLSFDPTRGNCSDVKKQFFTAVFYCLVFFLVFYFLNKEQFGKDVF